MKLHAAPGTRLLVALALATSMPRGLPAQAPCPDSSAAWMDSAWAALRAGYLDRAQEGFTRTAERCPAQPDPRAGLGFVHLRRSAPDPALAEFDAALARDSSHADAWYGRALALDRLGRTADASTSARTALEIAPGYHDARVLLDRIDPDWDRAPLGAAARPATLQLPARTRGTRFEVPQDGSWRAMTVRGVNLGAALPGRFPSEFPADSATYARWLGQMREMGANTVRLYTLLPPAFYRALRAHNLGHPAQVLYLLQGVWAELPPGNDFASPAWQAAFQAEMDDAVDVVHGHLDRAARPGHASGRYDADVSAWTLGWILGREWEPHAVEWFDAHGSAPAAAGRFVTASVASTAMERWLTAQADHLLAREFDRWHALRPVAFTNWPTLDPLHHPTEAGADEEAAWRARAGRPLLTTRREYENDGVSLDPTHVRPTADNPAGWFAAYHAYPYYPDFMNLDPGYRREAERTGASSYAAYLDELVRYHAGMPLVVAEVGLPSSRGRAHWQAQGLHHGGLDERAQAEGTVQLIRDVEASGAAGAVIFAWLDEWFKHNWVTIDLEVPAEHNPRWLNVEDAEQQYGIVGLYPGEGGKRPVPGGSLTPWQELAVHGRRSSGAARALRLGADEGHLYLMVELESAAARDPSLRVAMALDVVRPDLGQRRLPGGVASEVGFEFLVELTDSVGRMRVLPEYNPYLGAEALTEGDDQGRFHQRPLRPVNRDDGRWDAMDVIINRARYARDGTFTPAGLWERGRLRQAGPDASSLADWALDRSSGLLMLRLPWALLNLTDPSSHQVAFEFGREGEFGTVASEGVRVAVLAFRGDTLAGTLPAVRGGRLAAADLQPWRWPGWTVPSYHEALKPVYFAIRDLWKAP